jgi:hypothetical protein
VAARNCFFCGVRQGAPGRPEAKPIGTARAQPEASAPGHPRPIRLTTPAAVAESPRATGMAEAASSSAGSARNAGGIHYTPATPMPGSIEAALAQIADVTLREAEPWTVEVDEAPHPQAMGLEASPAAPVVPMPSPDDAPVVYMITDDPSIEEVLEENTSVPAAPIEREDRAKDALLASIALATAPPQGTLHDKASSQPQLGAFSAMEGSSSVKTALFSDAPAPRPKRRSWRWSLLDRMVIGLGGVVLLFVFARAAPLLMTFHGMALVLHEYFLSGGVLLLGASLLPLPERGRGLVGAGVGGLGLLLTVPSLTGFGVAQGIGVAVAFAMLPSGLLLWVRSGGSPLARTLVGGGVLLSVLLYFLPSDGVLPITTAFRLLIGGVGGSLLSSLYLLLPLLLALLALTTLGRSRTRLGMVWAALIVLLAPAVTMAAGLTREDPMMLHLGLALLGTGAVVSVGLTGALTPAPSPFG